MNDIIYILKYYKINYKLSKSSIYVGHNTRALYNHNWYVGGDYDEFLNYLIEDLEYYYDV